MFIIEGVTPSWLLWNKWNLLLTNRIRPIKNNVKEAQINILWPVWQTKGKNEGSETRQSATGDIPCPVGATYITITVCLCDRGKQENIDQFKQNSLITSQKFEETNCYLRTGCPNILRGCASLSSQKSKQIVSILNQSDWDTSSPPCLEILK